MDCFELLKYLNHFQKPKTEQWAILFSTSDARKDETQADVLQNSRLHWKLVIVAQMATTLAQLEFFGEGGHLPHPPTVLPLIESMLWRAKARHNMPKHFQAH